MKPLVVSDHENGDRVSITTLLPEFFPPIPTALQLALRIRNRYARRSTPNDPQPSLSLTPAKSPHLVSLSNLTRHTPQRGRQNPDSPSPCRTAGLGTAPLDACGSSCSFGCCRR